MKHVSDFELWNLIMQAGEAQARLAELQLKLISLTRPYLPPVPEPGFPPPAMDETGPPIPAAKDKDVPF